MLDYPVAFLEPPAALLEVTAAFPRVPIDGGFLLVDGSVRAAPLLR
jgi:hypothetical protein